LYVADRENHRMEVFDAEGRFRTQRNNMHKPAALFLDTRDPAGERIDVGELCGVGISEGVANLGARVSIYTTDGRLLARLGDRLPGSEPGQFVAPHSVAVDFHGDMYLDEVSWT
jgi:hypothetical protein